MKFASLIILISLSSSCTVDSKQASKSLDEAYSQALFEAIQLEGIVHNPCRGDEDYRYKACFLEKTGSAAITMEKLRDILVKAGFRTSSTGNMNGELNGVFTIPGTPYRLNSTFDSLGIMWVVYEKKVGFVKPRLEIDDPKAPHAIMLAKDFAKSRALIYLRFAKKITPIKEYENQLEMCGDAKEEFASYCIKPLLSRNQNFQSLARLSATEDISLFKKLDQQRNFKYKQDKLIEQGIRDGVLSKNYTSPLTFTKVKSGLYTMENRRDYPAYKVTYELTPKGDKYAVKVTATRIPIDPKAQKKEGE